MTRAAVIGIGRIGYELEHDELRSKPASHVGVYLECPKTELVGASDVDGAKLEEFSKEHPDIPAYSDYEVMLNREKPDIISICTPTETHCRIARNCARFNSTKVLWVEKPLASTVEESEKMIKTCDNFGTKLACNMTRRWDNAYQRIKQIVDGQDETWSIGELLMFEGRFSGDLIRDGVHMADLGMWLTDGDEGKIHLMNVPSSYIIFELEIWCENGLIRVLHNGLDIQLWFAEKSPKYQGFRELGGMIHLDETYNFSTAMRNAVDDLVECASSDKQPECVGLDGLNALKLCIKKTEG